MDGDNGSCLMEEITENTDIDEMVFDAIKVDVSFTRRFCSKYDHRIVQARMLHFIHRQDSR